MKKPQKQHIFPKPKFEGWKLASFSAALQIFQLIGSVISMFLIGSVGSHFPATYAALLTCMFTTIGSAVFLVSHVFNINNTEPMEWVFWETVYISSFTFFFIINTITMAYSSFRWGHASWWFATIICTMVLLSFFMSLIHIIKRQLKHLKESQKAPNHQSRIPPGISFNGVQVVRFE